MPAAMMFLSVFAAAWLAVAGTAIIHLRRWRGMRRNISLVARAGLLIWFTGVIAASFAGVRHWPTREIGQLRLSSRAGQRWRCRSLRFLIRLPQVAMSHQAPARLWERS